jgi:hypothetical protein
LIIRFFGRTFLIVTFDWIFWIYLERGAGFEIVKILKYFEALADLDYFLRPAYGREQMVWKK